MFSSEKSCNSNNITEQGVITNSRTTKSPHQFNYLLHSTTSACIFPLKACSSLVLSQLNYLSYVLLPFIEIDKLCSWRSPAKAKARAKGVMVFALYTQYRVHHHRLCLAVSQLPVVRSEHVWIVLNLWNLYLRSANMNFTQQCLLRHILQACYRRISSWLSIHSSSHSDNNLQTIPSISG